MLKKDHKNLKTKILAILLILIFFEASNILMNLNYAINPVFSSKTLALPIPNHPNINWPPKAQSAVGLVGQQQIVTNGLQKSTPIASTAKLITILSVLSVKPLYLNQQGPTITINAKDVAIYNNYVAEQGSVVPVALNETITEYQVIEAMLLPSANNMADTLATWAFGSLANYANYANNYLRKIGVNNTHVGLDASGYDPSTTSTAKDLVKIGELAISNPVIAQIVALPSANIPVANNIKNLNFLLGKNNIIGIKTGNTNQAGGVFVSASKKTVNHHNLTIVTAVLGTPNLYLALAYSNKLIVGLQNSFTNTTILKTSTSLGSYNLPWGGKDNVVVSKKVNLTSWLYSTQKAYVILKSIKTNTKQNQNIGNINIPANGYNNFKAYSLTPAKPLSPPIWWLLSHINL